MSKKKSWAKRRRKKLMDEDPHCHWCGIEVVYFETDGSETLPDDFATIDHLYDRFDFELRSNAWKRATRSSVPSTVLACHRCNQRRCRERQKELNRKSKSFMQTRYKLLEERRKIGSNTPRPQVLKGINKLIEWDER